MCWLVQQCTLQFFLITKSSALIMPLTSASVPICEWECVIPYLTETSWSENKTRGEKHFVNCKALGTGRRKGFEIKKHRLIPKPSEVS